MGVGNEDPKWRSVNLGLSGKQIHQLLFILLRKALTSIKKINILGILALLKHEDYLCY